MTRREPPRGNEIRAVAVTTAAGWLSGCAGQSAPTTTTASGLATLAVLLAALLYVVRRRSIVVSLHLMRPFATVPTLRRLAAAAVQLDRLASWRRAHLLIGVLVAAPLAWHVTTARGGLLETALLGLLGVALATGMAGMILQVVLPRRMLRLVEREVRTEDIEARQRALFVRAEEQILGRSEALVDAYLRHVRPILQGDPARWRLLSAALRGGDPGRLVERKLHPHGEALNSADRTAFAELTGLAETKVRLDLNRLHLDLTTGWLSLHATAVSAAVALVVLHLVAVAYYGGP